MSLRYDLLRSMTMELELILDTLTKIRRVNYGDYVLSDDLAKILQVIDSMIRFVDDVITLYQDLGIYVPTDIIDLQNEIKTIRSELTYPKTGDFVTAHSWAAVTWILAEEYILLNRLLALQDILFLYDSSQATDTATAQPLQPPLWPQILYDPQNTGLSPYNNVIYTNGANASYQAKIMAMDTSGNILWTYIYTAIKLYLPIINDYIATTANLVADMNGYIYTVDGNGNLIVLDQNGQLVKSIYIAQLNLPPSYYGLAPILYFNYNNTLYIIIDVQTIYILEYGSDTPTVTTLSYGEIYSLTIDYNNTMFFTVLTPSNTISIVATDPNINILWIYDTNNSIMSFPSITHNSVIYAVSGLGGTVTCSTTPQYTPFYALDYNGNLLWSVDVPYGDVFNVPVTSSDGAYVVSLCNFVSYVTSDGQLAWTLSLASVAGSAIALRTYGIGAIDKYDNVYFAATNLGLVSVDVNGNVRWNNNSLTTRPIIIFTTESDYVYASIGYCGSAGCAGYIYALDINGNLLWSYNDTEYSTMFSMVL